MGRALSPSHLLPFSNGESPSNHRHLINPNVGGGSHDVPQPPHCNVRLHPGADRWGAGRAQRLLPGHLSHAGVPRTGSRWRWDTVWAHSHYWVTALDKYQFRENKNTDGETVFLPGGVPQVFLTAPPGTVQIPVSAVQLHPVRQDLHFTSETLIFPMQPACHVIALMHPNRALAHRGHRLVTCCLLVWMWVISCQVGFTCDLKPKTRAAVD